MSGLLDRATPSVPVAALLSPVVVEQHAVRLFARSGAAPSSSESLPEVIAAAWERLPEPMRTGFTANARRDLEAAIAAADELAT